MSYNYLLYEYTPVLITLILSFIVPFLLLALSLFFNFTPIDPEKLSPYECGFNPFSDSRQTFDVKFYLTAMMFIIFDIEIVLLIPCVSNIFTLAESGLFIIFLFTLLLTFGFVYEWKSGAFNWET